MALSTIKMATRYCSALFFAVMPVYADNLIQVYNLAMQNDPIFAQAQSTWNAQKMNIPIAQAGYLPQLSLISNAARVYTSDTSTNTSTSNYAWQYGYTLTASQAIFNLVDWEQIKGADDSVKSATATYLAAQQSLMQRTVSAYFAVLLAHDQLRLTIGEKRDLWRQYLNSEEQYHAGIIAVTDANNALSDYDQAVTNQVAAENNLNIQLENLRALTGKKYDSLSGVGVRLPLINPILKASVPNSAIISIGSIRLSGSDLLIFLPFSVRTKPCR